MSPSGNRHPADIPCPVCGESLARWEGAAVTMISRGRVIARLIGGVADLHCGREHNRHACPGHRTLPLGEVNINVQA